MMMRAFPPSAATASDATTTSGFGSGLGSGSQSKNRRCYLKLILCCFLPISFPQTKFLPNWTKNIEVEKICISRLWLVGPLIQKIAVFISNSFYFVFSPILNPEIFLKTPPELSELFLVLMSISAS